MLLSQNIATRLITFAIAGAGVAVFKLFSLPLPWLLGPIFGCLIAALFGVNLKGISSVSTSMRTILGVAVGASITPALIGRLDEMALSIAMVPIFIFAIGLFGYPYFRKICGFDKATSYYAAMPGGLQDMLVFGQEAGGSVRTLSLVHATRVLIVVTALPLILTFGMGINLDNPPGIPTANLPFIEAIIMIFCGFAGWWFAAKIGLFGASIIGPMIFATVASLTGLIHNRPPAEAVILAQFFLGAGIGVTYVGITVQELKKVVVAAVGYCVILGILSAIFTEISILAGFAPFMDSVIAFSPGGQAEMAILAIVAGADIAYIVSHHIIRIILVILFAPLVQRFL